MQDTVGSEEAKDGMILPLPVAHIVGLHLGKKG